MIKVCYAIDLAVQVAYIDTEGTFRAEKIRAIAARFDLDADAVLDNVRHNQLKTAVCACRAITSIKRMSTEQVIVRADHPCKSIHT